jgi:hypothetical protein
MGIIRRDAELFLDLSEHLLEKGYRVRFRAHGASMQPAIADGDALTLEPTNPAAAQPGDILLYRRHRRSIAHRVVEVEQAGHSVATILLRGDAQLACDVPVEPDDVLGKVVAVEPGPGPSDRLERPRLDASRFRFRFTRFIRTAASRLARPDVPSVSRSGSATCQNGSFQDSFVSESPNRNTPKTRRLRSRSALSA